MFGNTGTSDFLNALWSPYPISHFGSTYAWKHMCFIPLLSHWTSAGTALPTFSSCFLEHSWSPKDHDCFNDHSHHVGWKKIWILYILSSAPSLCLSFSLPASPFASPRFSLSQPASLSLFLPLSVPLSFCLSFSLSITFLLAISPKQITH